jgi:hypothetical protein
MRTKPDLDGPFVRKCGSTRKIPLRTKIVWSKELEALMEESVQREIERWARKLLLVSNGQVRKFTAAEVRVFRHF